MVVAHLRYAAGSTPTSYGHIHREAAALGEEEEVAVVGKKGMVGWVSGAESCYTQGTLAIAVRIRGGFVDCTSMVNGSKLWRPPRSLC